MTEEMTENTRTKRVEKFVAEDTGIVTFRAAGEDGKFETAVEIDPAELSDDIQEKLMVHGLLSKIGDAAAGKSGQEAAEAMQKVAEQLREGHWTVRRQGNSVKASKADMLSKLAEKSPEEQAAAKALLASLGIEL